MRGAPISRRCWIVASASTLGSAAVPGTALGGRLPAQGKARSTILFFLCGGASHIDTWDLKPEAPAEYRGEFQPTRTTVPGMLLCEHLPLTARQAHHIALVHGVTDGGKATGDHHAGYYYNLTGAVPDSTFRTQGNDRRPYPDDAPFMGSVVGSRLPSHPSLPQVITLPHKPSRPPYTRPGQFAGRLGAEHDPLYLTPDPNQPLRFQAPSLVLDASLGRERFEDRRRLLRQLDRARPVWDASLAAKNLERQQRKAFELLTSARTTGAFDLSAEPDRVRTRYGKTINGTSLLMARRLVEAGVPFVTVFWKEDLALAKKCRSAGGWDTHGNNFGCLKENLLPEFDRAYSALLADLHDRGLLEETLVLVTSEMGRRPLIGDRRSGGVRGAGRDHWTACMSVLFAGGGVEGGRIIGASDERAEYPRDNPIGPDDVVKTVYHAMGVDRTVAEQARAGDSAGLATGSPILKLF